MERYLKIPSVSIIIPIYNQEKFIKKTIESILAQTFRDFEILLVDDASEDGSPLIGKSFAEKYQNILYFQHANNRGPGAARNTGIEAARGSFFAFLDGDDLMRPHCLDHQMQWLRMHTGIDILYTALEVVDETGKFLTHLRGHEEKPENFFPLMLFRNQIPGPGMIFAKKNVFEKERYPEDRKHGEDYALMLRLAEKQYRFSYLDEPLYIHRRHAHNLSNQIKMHQQSETEIVARYSLATVEKAIALSSFSPEEKILLLAKILWNQNEREAAVEKFASLASEEAYFYLGNYWLQKGEIEKASLLFGRGIAMQSFPNPAILNNQGVALSRLGRKEEAQKLFTRALSIAPSYLDAQRNLLVLSTCADKFAITSRFLRVQPLPYRVL